MDTPGEAVFRRHVRLAHAACRRDGGGDCVRRGDIDRPYIAHAFHDSAHRDIVTRDNRSQNILCTAADNELRMENRRGQEHIALTTPYGSTQLGQGYLVDAQDQPRGTGFELRTDEYGVIRVAKGLFITADGQQAMFARRLAPLNGMLHFHGPQGVAFTCGEHIQLTAAQNVAVNAGGDISSGSLSHTAVLAGESLGLFARSAALTLNASEGPVQIQAQNGEMHLIAEQRVSLISAVDMLFAGKKKVILIGGGKIEYVTDMTYTRKIRRTHLTGPASQPVEFPEINPAMMDKICIPCLLKAIQDNDVIVQGA